MACTIWETTGPEHPWAATDHVGVPPPCPCTADPPQRVEVGGRWSQPVVVADWTG